MFPLLVKLNPIEPFSSIFFSIQTSIMTQKLSNLTFAYDAHYQSNFNPV